jgi:hypothetical protein
MRGAQFTHVHPSDAGSPRGHSRHCGAAWEHSGKMAPLGEQKTAKLEAIRAREGTKTVRRAAPGTAGRRVQEEWSQRPPLRPPRWHGHGCGHRRCPPRPPCRIPQRCHTPHRRATSNARRPCSGRHGGTRTRPCRPSGSLFVVAGAGRGCAGSAARRQHHACPPHTRVCRTIKLRTPAPHSTAMAHRAPPPPTHRRPGSSDLEPKKRPRDRGLP